MDSETPRGNTLVRAATLDQAAHTATIVGDLEIKDYVVLPRTLDHPAHTLTQHLLQLVLLNFRTLWTLPSFSHMYRQLSTLPSALPAKDDA
jgi:hypothetical protein